MRDKYIEIAKEIILGYINRDEINVFLFGSRVTDDSRRGSDIDIGFLGNEEINHRIFRKIVDDLEDSVVPYHFDLVDFSKVDESFKKIALQKIIIWNKAKSLAIN